MSFGSNFVAAGLVEKKHWRNGVETYIAVTLSKAIDRACHFSIGRIHAIMNASLKSKRNDSEEVSFGSNFVASVSVAKNLHDFDGWHQVAYFPSSTIVLYCTPK